MISAALTDHIKLQNLVKLNLKLIVELNFVLNHSGWFDFTNLCPSIGVKQVYIYLTKTQNKFDFIETDILIYWVNTVPKIGEIYFQSIQNASKYRRNIRMENGGFNLFTGQEILSTLHGWSILLVCLATSDCCITMTRKKPLCWWLNVIWTDCQNNYSFRAIT